MKSEKGKLVRKLLMMGVLMTGIGFTGSQFNTDAAPTKPPCGYCEVEYRECVYKCQGQPACIEVCETQYNQCADFWCPPPAETM